MDHVLKKVHSRTIKNFRQKDVTLFVETKVSGSQGPSLSGTQIYRGTLVVTAGNWKLNIYVLITSDKKRWTRNLDLTELHERCNREVCTNRLTNDKWRPKEKTDPVRMNIMDYSRQTRCVIEK